MKLAKLIICVSLFILCTNCKTQNKQVSIPKLSIEECLQRNLKNNTLMTGWYVVEGGGFIRKSEQTGELFSINPCPIVTAEDIIKMEIRNNRWGDTMLVMSFGKRGTELWSIATEKSIGKQFVFIVNDKLWETSTVQSHLSNGVSAIWNDKTKLEMIKQNLK